MRVSAKLGHGRYHLSNSCAGEAQTDFDEALVTVASVEQKAHSPALDQRHSHDCFEAAFPTETTEAFLEGHVCPFVYFGGASTKILYDNTKILYDNTKIAVL